MDLDALRYGNFHQLGEAIGDWEGMAKQLRTLADDAEKNLKGKARKAKWAGVNATVTREFIDRTAGEYADAHTQADTIARILKDTRGELIGYRTQLNDAIDRAVRKRLAVSDTGKGGFTVTAADRSEDGSEPEGRSAAAVQKDVDEARDEIQRILDKAGESDSTAAKALRLIVDQAKYGFGDVSYRDRDAAAKAIAEADAMARILAKDPHDVTNTELAALNAALAKYKDDPLFAEEFATQAGPKRLFAFWAGIADPFQGDYDPERAEQAKQLQKNLGIVLGQATLSDSDRMQSWEKRVIELGPHQLGTDDAGNPTGYAVMSNLMRFGDYDDQFLNDYGRELLAYDEQVNGEGISLWVNNANQGDLNFWGYKNDRGRDPVTGFLEALGHNPDASTQFFAAPDSTVDPTDEDYEVNAHLKYLTQERVWASDVTLEGDHGYVAGRASLGHALEAATTGYPFDATADQVKAGGDHRTSATADVMEQVSCVYGSEDGPELLHKQPEMATSLGKMAGAYIDDLNYSLSGLGDYARGNDFPQAYGGSRAEFGNQGAIDFLSVLGQNETSHGIVTAQQHLYTSSLLDRYPPTSEVNYDHGLDALMTEAQARGILDHSRVQQASADYGAESEEANKSLGRSTEWGKLLAGAVVGAGVAALPLPGSTAAGFAVAPLAADFGGQVVNTFVGQEIDEASDEAKEDPVERSQITSREFYRKGTGDLGRSYDAYFAPYQEAKTRADVAQTTLQLKTTYLAMGTAEAQVRGRLPYKD
ncbi:hypothetical protein ACWC10_07320 [Streptomyces sp. NPDC001595]|uniref:hypothetical protein n=1 Tax=Streptomyces sp. NPDC001532 TaxID=3154520 RepID=UPI0033238E5C